MSHEARHGSLAQLGYGAGPFGIADGAQRWQGLGEGKTAVVTGANAGLGFFASLALAQAGTHVILACRNQSRAERAMAAIAARVPGASTEFMQFDSSSLASATMLAAELRHRQLDILIANAGMIRTPEQRQEGLLGHEMVMSTNFIGHARLAGELADHFTGSALRFIALGSMSTRLLATSPNNLALRQGYGKYRAYVQSKAALQSFAMALDHRLHQLGAASRSLAVHPGYCLSGLSPQLPGINEPGYAKRLAGRLQQPFSQGKHHGAAALVEAALTPGIERLATGAYFGPQFLSKGRIVLASPAGNTRSKALQDAVWKLFCEANDGLDPFAIN